MPRVGMDDALAGAPSIRTVLGNVLAGATGGGFVVAAAAGGFVAAAAAGGFADEVVAFASFFLRNGVGLSARVREKKSAFHTMLQL